jgi:hypothetical protein
MKSFLNTLIVGECMPQLKEKRNGTKALVESCVFTVHISSQGDHSIFLVDSNVDAFAWVQAKNSIVDLKPYFILITIKV